MRTLFWNCAEFTQLGWVTLGNILITFGGSFILVPKIEGTNCLLRRGCLEQMYTTKAPTWR